VKRMSNRLSAQGHLRRLLEGIIELAEQKGRPWSAEALADARDGIEYLSRWRGLNGRAEMHEFCCLLFAKGWALV
jgi:hypothetical protein